MHQLVLSGNSYVLARRDGVLIDGRPGGASRQILTTALQREGRGPGTRSEENRAYMVGQIVNHPPAGMQPNVAVAPLDLWEEDESLWREIAAVNFRPSAPGQPRVQTAALVALRELCDEELLLDYKLQLQGPLEPWYTPVPSDVQPV